MNMFSKMIAVMLALAFSSIGTPTRAADTSKAGGEVDWAKGLNQETEANCGAFQFKNDKPGEVFGLLVQGTKTAVCTFREEGVVFHMPNDFGATIAGHTTLFSFTRIGNEIFVAWVRPYD